ncbi:hypothetical protein C8Q79DRAFT_600316 [Trametes meyenii]|nr:hypothetical protein C8Q79DRAFT_600316 [Trametes meyenii]
MGCSAGIVGRGTGRGGERQMNGRGQRRGVGGDGREEEGEAGSRRWRVWDGKLCWALRSAGWTSRQSPFVLDLLLNLPASPVRPAHAAITSPPSPAPNCLLQPLPLGLSRIARTRSSVIHATRTDAGTHTTTTSPPSKPKSQHNIILDAKATPQDRAPPRPLILDCHCRLPLASALADARTCYLGRSRGMRPAVLALVRHRIRPHRPSGRTRTNNGRVLESASAQPVSPSSRTRRGQHASPRAPSSPPPPISLSPQANVVRPRLHRPVPLPRIVPDGRGAHPRVWPIDIPNFVLTRAAPEPSLVQSSDATAASIVQLRPWLRRFAPASAAPAAPLSYRPGASIAGAQLSDPILRLPRPRIAHGDHGRIGTSTPVIPPTAPTTHDPDSIRPPPVHRPRRRRIAAQRPQTNKGAERSSASRPGSRVLSPSRP